MKERLIIIIIAIVAGLFITGAGFFIYQSAQKTSADVLSTPKTAKDTTSQQGQEMLKISEPSDGQLSEKRTLQVKGTTDPNNTIIISTNEEDVSGKPNAQGDFAITIDIDAGANEIITRSIAPNGDSTQDVRTVTYSTEDF